MKGQDGMWGTTWILESDTPEFNCHSSTTSNATNYITSQLSVPICGMEIEYCLIQ